MIIVINRDVAARVAVDRVAVDRVAYVALPGMFPQSARIYEADRPGWRGITQHYQEYEWHPTKTPRR